MPMYGSQSADCVCLSSAWPICMALRYPECVCDERYAYRLAKYFLFFPAMSARSAQPLSNLHWPLRASFWRLGGSARNASVSYTHLRAHETDSYLVCRLLLEKKKK